MPAAKKRKVTEERPNRKMSAFWKSVLGLLGTGGITTILIALINRESHRADRHEPASSVTADRGGTAIVAEHSNVNVGVTDERQVNLLQQIRDLLASNGKPPLPAIEEQAQREALKTLEADPNAAIFQMPSNAPKWVRIAFAEIGEERFVNGTPNPRVLEYLKTANLPFKYSEGQLVPWSGCFISWVFLQAGYANVPRNGSVRSFRDWGTSATTPTLGTLVLLDWGALDGRPFGREHAGFWLQDLGDKMLIVAGNVRGAVKIQAVPKAAVVGLRNPPTV